MATAGLEAARTVKESSSDATCPLAEPLFLLERMSHIRVICLTVHAGEPELTLTAADAVAQGSLVSLSCSFEGAHDSDGLPTSTRTCLQLDVGEQLDCRTAVSCAVTDGFAYARLPLAPETLPDVSDSAPRAPAVKTRITIFWGKAGSRQWGTPVPCAPKSSSVLLRDASEQLREESGMLHRAADQRRWERAALADAQLHCAKCSAPPPQSQEQRASGGGPPNASSALAHVVGTPRFLPDPRAIHDDLLADFLEMGRSHAILPPRMQATATDAKRGDDAAADGTISCFLGRHTLHVRAPPPPPSLAACGRAEAFLGGEPAPTRALWAPLVCMRCGATLGATQLESSEGATSACDEARAAPMWFDASAAPELRCSLQLLKSAVRCVPPAVEAAVDASRVFRCYSMATLVADQILRAAAVESGEHTRHFALVGGSAAEGDGSVEGSPGASVHAIIMLLSPFVTLATNRLAADGGKATDAIKVMYTIDAATIAALSGGAVRRLEMPTAADRQAVLAALESSSEMLPPQARCVGALRVGYLPVAPTWD